MFRPIFSPPTLRFPTTPDSPCVWHSVGRGAGGRAGAAGAGLARSRAPQLCAATSSNQVASTGLLAPPAGSFPPPPSSPPPSGSLGSSPSRGHLREVRALSHNPHNLAGFNHVPPKPRPPELRNVTLFGNWVYTDVDIKMRKYRIGVDPKCND